MAEKIALITGANRGIGFETAKQLLEKDITVIFGARELRKSEQAIESLPVAKKKAVPCEIDVISGPSIEKAVQFVEKKFGRLDILINNAAIFLDDYTHDVSETSLDLIRKTFETNFFAVIAVTQAFLPLIMKSPGGRIVNLSSILGSLTLQSTPGSPLYGSKAFAYDASKTAINALTVHLACDLKDTNIKVNSAHPGWVRTDMGGPNAPLDVVQGAKTSVELALLPDNAPSGAFFHLGEPLPW